MVDFRTCAALVLIGATGCAPTAEMGAAATGGDTGGSAGAAGSGATGGSGGFGGVSGSGGFGGVAGSAGSAGASGTGAPLANCDPGTYVGTYDCMLDQNGMPTFPLTGAVAFELAIDETMTNMCQPGEEFCQDLVIPEGSGTLFGFAGFIGFETHLQGGLDCRTGEFRATAVDGIWGIPVAKDPSDPMSPLTVALPPAGMFDGTLMGTHDGGTPQKIAGTWSLVETASMTRCPGPFRVERQ